MFSNKQYVCKSCNHVGKSKSFVPGSFVIELFAWLCLILPGLIYTLWRASSKKKVCEMCSSKEIIGIDTPMGRKMVKELTPKTA